jgi:PBSX family phage terminase large subunit
MPSEQLTERQIAANKLLGSGATHIMLYGGSRSGKTFLLVRAILKRAARVTSRHAVFRHRFNHLKASIILDTLPKVITTCFEPELQLACTLDKSDWVYRLPNGSEIWFGGLDDRERTEKVLGQEHSTLYFNECSQIAWTSRNIAMTRLEQSTELPLRAYYDCNPPGDGHWTARLFINKQDPDTRQNAPDPDRYAAMLLNPGDNLSPIPGLRLRQQAYDSP